MKIETAGNRASGGGDLQMNVSEALLRGAHSEGAVAARADLPALQLPHAADDRLLPRPLLRHHPAPAARARASRDPPRLHPRLSPKLPRPPTLPTQNTESGRRPRQHSASRNEAAAEELAPMRGFRVWELKLGSEIEGREKHGRVGEERRNWAGVKKMR
jgi:hypothetical protein